MKSIGRIFGISSLIVMIIGLIPLLGWLNWFGIPLAVLGLILSTIGKSRGGMIICGIAIFVGLLRLSLGGGII